MGTFDEICDIFFKKIKLPSIYKFELLSIMVKRVINTRIAYGSEIIYYCNHKDMTIYDDLLRYLSNYDTITDYTFLEDMVLEFQDNIFTNTVISTSTKLHGITESKDDHKLIELTITNNSGLTLVDFCEIIYQLRQIKYQWDLTPIPYFTWASNANDPNLIELKVHFTEFTDLSKFDF